MPGALNPEIKILTRSQESSHYIALILQTGKLRLREVKNVLEKRRRERKTVRDAVTRRPGELPPALRKPLKKKKKKKKKINKQKKQ